MTPTEIITTYVFGDLRLLGINTDANLGLCEVDISVEDDMLDISTTYKVRAIYNDSEAEMLRKLML